MIVCGIFYSVFHLQLSKMTEKVQRLTKGLVTEKASVEHLQKSASEHSNQQTAENRKLALEISKLKVKSVNPLFRQ